MLKLFNTVDALVEKISRLCTLVGVVSILLLMALITANTLMRYLFNSPMIHTVELSAYGFILISYLGFAYAVRTNAHVGVDLVQKHFPPDARAIADFVTTGMAVLLVCVLTYYAAHQLAVEFKRGTRSWTTLQTPIWMPLSVLVFGLGVFVLELALRLAKIAMGIDVSGDPLPDDGARE